MTDPRVDAETALIAAVVEFTEARCRLHAGEPTKGAYIRTFNAVLVAYRAGIVAELRGCYDPETTEEGVARAVQERIAELEAGG